MLLTTFALLALLTFVDTADYTDAYYYELAGLFCFPIQKAGGASVFKVGLGFAATYPLEEPRLNGLISSGARKLTTVVY